MNISSVALLLQEVPQQALVLAMALSYALSFAGMLLAWHAYRKRQRGTKTPPEEKHTP